MAVLLATALASAAILGATPGAPALGASARTPGVEHTGNLTAAEITGTASTDSAAGASSEDRDAAPGKGAKPEPASDDGVPALVRRAVDAARAAPNTEAEVRRYRSFLPEGCAPIRAAIDRPIERSGRSAVKLFGRDDGGLACEGWAWADVRLVGDAWVTTRAVRAGEALADATRKIRQEIVGGRRPIHRLPPEAVARRDLIAGKVIGEKQLQAGAAPGEPLKVILRSGSLSVEAWGRAVGCGRGRSCATLPSGKRVEGRMEANALVVETS